ncbi:hypothetical protein KBD71_01210 [Candidatus Woesebacteria bacterium]|nr:hypothetical protein [Candidatus Woesebacteria bacterium]
MAAFLTTLIVETNSPDLLLLEKLTHIDRLVAHPDFHTIAPLEDKSSISIDQVHQLATILAVKPSTLQSRLILITPAHQLTLPAQQALLKTLEEPPAQTQLILATAYPFKLLPTILSRCQRIPVKTAGPGSFPNQPIWETLLSSGVTISTCIELASTLASNKETAICAVYELHEFLTKTHQNQPVLRKEVIKTLGLLEKNVNAKLAVECLFFTLRQSSMV